jgi:hypothetical protein
MLNKLSAISKSYTEVRESSVCVCVCVCVCQGFGRAMRGRLTVVLSDVESYLVSTNHQYSELSCASVSVSSLRLKDLLIYHRMGGN